MVSKDSKARAAAARMDMAAWKCAAARMDMAAWRCVAVRMDMAAWKCAAARMDMMARKGMAARMGAVIACAVMMCMVLLNAGAVYAASDFAIEDYDVRMTVNEDDTYQVTETIKVHYTAPSHGIYRTIPRRTILDRDGQRSVYNAAVKDFKVVSGQRCEKDKESSDFMWRIGDPDEYAETDTVYELTFLYDNRGDHFKGGDELYYNLVGTTWEAQSIDHVSWEITFPKDIDPAKVGMKTGAGEDVPFEVTGSRTVTGETDLDTLGGLTIRAVLPEGYFTKQAGSATMAFYVIAGLLAAVAGAGVVLWRRHGIDPVYPETVEFYPPEGLSAPEAAYLEKGDISKTDVISILLTLADRGYLVIHEVEKEPQRKKRGRKAKAGKGKTKTSYEIERVREYDGDDEAERMFMEGLFKDAELRPASEAGAALAAEKSLDSAAAENGEAGIAIDVELGEAGEPGRVDAESASHLYVEMEDLEDSFYETADDIGKMISDKYEGKLYDADAEKYAGIMDAAGAVGVIVLIAAARLVGGLGLGWPPEGIIMLALQPILMIVGFKTIGSCVKERNGIAKMLLGALIAAAGIGLVLLAGTTYGTMIIPFLIGAGMCLLLFIIGGLCGKKTEFYAEIQAKIRGYKRFLETAEKDKLEMLAEQDPGYYYRNLAYAFALGVTAVYARRFVSMAQRAPDWYDTPSHHYYGRGYGDDTGFTADGLVNSINDMMTSVSTSMSSSPSDGGGGGSFSGGGGGGGGGGGSW